MSKMIFGKLNHGNVKEKEWFTRGWLSASYIESIFVRIVSRNSIIPIKMGPHMLVLSTEVA